MDDKTTAGHTSYATSGSVIDEARRRGKRLGPERIAGASGFGASGCQRTKYAHAQKKSARTQNAHRHQAPAHTKTPEQSGPLGGYENQDFLYGEGDTPSPRPYPREITKMKKYAALYCRKDSAYKNRPAWDVYDKDRDARSYVGMLPVVCHPPCRCWSQLNSIHKNWYPGEMLYPWLSMEMIMSVGGILEHPMGSNIWPVFHNMPGMIIGINQLDFGHVCSKPTMLWIYPKIKLPEYPIPKYSAKKSITGLVRNTERCTQKEREHTPELLIDWFEEILNKIKEKYN